MQTGALGGNAPWPSVLLHTVHIHSMYTSYISTLDIHLTDPPTYTPCRERKRGTGERGKEEEKGEKKRKEGKGKKGEKRKGEKKEKGKEGENNRGKGKGKKRKETNPKVRPQQSSPAGKPPAGAPAEPNIFKYPPPDHKGGVLNKMFGVAGLPQGGRENPKKS